MSYWSRQYDLAIRELEDAYTRLQRANERSLALRDEIAKLRGVADKNAALRDEEKKLEREIEKKLKAKGKKAAKERKEHEMLFSDDYGYPRYAC